MDNDVLSVDLRRKLITVPGVTMTTQRKDADVFVVHDPAKVSRRIE